MTVSRLFPQPEKQSQSCGSQRHGCRHAPQAHGRKKIFLIAFELFRSAHQPVVDVGCGVGLLAFYLRERNFLAPISGLDRDGRKITRAQAVARGAYLVKLGRWADCHTPSETGQQLPGLDFAGGFVTRLPTGVVASANITPDPSGISYYDENLFIHAMREGKVGARQLNAAMPWWLYGKMTDDDLKSVFAYLRTLKPIKHRVDNAVPATYCKLCRQQHGLGEGN